MAQVRESGGEAANYLHVRKDWLDRRKEPILEPELPIVDPHHHLWDRAGLALPARRSAGRHQQRPQHRRDRLRPARVDASRRRPGGDEAGRRDRVRQRRRRDDGERPLRPDRVCAGIVGHADLTLGARVEPVLEAHRARRRRALPRHPPHHRVGRRSAGAQSRPSARRRACWPIRHSAKASACWRRMGLSFDAWLYHPQIDELTALADAVPDARSCSITAAAARSAIYAVQARRGLPGLEEIDRGAGERPNVTSSSAAWACGICGSWLRRAAEPPSSETLADVAALHRDLHRGVRRQAPHVREQLPGRQGLVQLRGVLERLQDLAKGASASEKADCYRDGEAVLSLGRLTSRRSPTWRPIWSKAGSFSGVY